ncbi:MAG: ABC transporter permease [Candidatus Nomurabacteria bacterium]|nr:MAG: ABC transporter permease [Candidatus Nomurabacteria bacterium]
MQSKLWIIAFREWWKIVRKKSFWAVIFLIPALYVVLLLVSTLSASSAEKKIQEQVKNAKEILVVDESGIILPEYYQGAIVSTMDASAARSAVQDKQADAAIIVPANVTETKQVELVVEDTSFATRGRFDDLAKNLLKQSILSKVGDNQEIELFNSDIAVTHTLYKDGDVVQGGIESLVLPIVAVVIYFLLVMMSSSYMLMSISEEKENRMIEIVRSIVPMRTLLWGKLLGLTAVALTQLLTLSAIILAIGMVSSATLIDINWSMVHISFGQILIALYFVFSGFFFIASIMVGVGAAMPNYRDAQQFSSIFIMLSILPIYLASILATDPGGSIARFFSFFPFTAPLVLLFRSSVDAIGIGELLLGVAAVFLYIVIGLYLAFAMFRIGSMEYTEKLSWKLLLHQRKR